MGLPDTAVHTNAVHTIVAQCTPTVTTRVLEYQMMRSRDQLDEIIPTHPGTPFLAGRALSKTGPARVVVVVTVHTPLSHTCTGGSTSVPLLPC